MATIIKQKNEKQKNNQRIRKAPNPPPLIAAPKDDFSSVNLGDKRLNDRLNASIDKMTQALGGSVLNFTKDRGQAKAFYRLLGNNKLELEKLHNASNAATLSRSQDTILVIQDSSEINLSGHKKTKGLGYCNSSVRGIKIHSCIAVSPDGMPLGLLTQSYLTREQRSNPLTEARKQARPIKAKESHLWLKTLQDVMVKIPEGVCPIVICDREADFYELYVEMQQLNVDFVIRVTHERNSDQNDKILVKLRVAKVIGKVTVNIPRDSRRNIPARKAKMKVSSLMVTIPRPKNVRNKSVPEKTTMNLVRIVEVKPPKGQSPIEWILSTSLPAREKTDMMRVVAYYVQRWKIERFHYVLKSGLGVEKIQQRTLEGIKIMLLLYSVIGMYIMALTYVGRISPNFPCSAFLDKREWTVLYYAVNKTKYVPQKPISTGEAIEYISRLGGGYKRSPSDGPPGLKSIWKGLFVLYNLVDFVGQV